MRKAGLASLSCALVVLALGGASGCDVFRTMHSDHTGRRSAPSAPQAAVAPMVLTQEPDGGELVSHYCSVLASGHGAGEPLASEASAACRARGPAPDDSQFGFRTRFEAEVRSSNPIRLEIRSVLLVLSIYPEAGVGTRLGAVCLTLCDEGDTTCPQTPEACRTAEDDVLDLGDVDAVDGFVTSVALDESHLSDLAVHALPAHGDTTLRYDLALDTDAVLDAIRENDAAAMGAIRAGQAPTFTIPYAIEGTYWIEGRGNDGFAEPIPRTTGEWTIPAS